MALAFPRFSLSQTLLHPTSCPQFSSVLFTCPPSPSQFLWRADGKQRVQDYHRTIPTCFSSDDPQLESLRAVSVPGQVTHC